MLNWVHTKCSSDAHPEDFLGVSLKYICFVTHFINATDEHKEKHWAVHLQQQEIIAAHTVSFYLLWTHITNVLVDGERLTCRVGRWVCGWKQTSCSGVLSGGKCLIDRETWSHWWAGPPGGQTQSCCGLFRLSCRKPGSGGRNVFFYFDRKTRFT